MSAASRPSEHPDDEDTESNAPPAVSEGGGYQHVTHDRTDTEAFSQQTPFGAARADVEPPPWMRPEVASAPPAAASGPSSAEIVPRQVMAAAADPDKQQRATSRQMALAVVAVLVLVGGGAAAFLVVGGGGASVPEPTAGAPAVEATDAGGDAKRKIKLKDQELGGIKVHGGGLKRKPLPPKRNLALPVQNAEDDDEMANAVPDPQPIPTGPTQDADPGTEPEVPDPGPPGEAPASPDAGPDAAAPPPPEAAPPAEQAADGDEMAPPQVYAPDAR